VAVAFLLLVFFAHLPVARDAGPDPLRQAHHPAAAAAAAGVVVAEAPDHERSAFFLVARALHPIAVHRPAARPADVIPLADLREVRFAQLRP